MAYKSAGPDLTGHEDRAESISIDRTDIVSQDAPDMQGAPARLADEFVRRLGLTWPDVIFVAPEWTAMAKACREHAHLLTEREAEFVAAMSRWRRMPSDKQLAWLCTIYERLSEEASL